MIINLEIRWTVSKGKDSYGYNICSLWNRGTKVASTCGGGYDMTGMAFAKFLEDAYMDRIIAKLKHTIPKENEYCMSEEYYGFLRFKNGKYHINGACGLDCMFKIAKVIGLEIQSVYGKNRLTNILIEDIGGIA